MSVGVRAGLWTACFLWAISFIATKIALAEALPLFVVTTRLLISAGCFALWFVASRKRPSFIHKGLARRLFLLSLFGTGLHYGIQTIGLKYTFASNASIYAVTGPVCIALMASLSLGERIGWRKAGGISLALAGVLQVIGWDTILAFQIGERVLGDLLVLASIVLWAAFTVYGKKLIDEHGALEVIGTTTIIGALWMTPVGVAECILANKPPFSIPWKVWGAIAFLGVGCSFLATFLYFLALKYTESQKVGVYLYTIPPMTYGVAALVLGEPITSGLVIGSGFILAGVYITEKA